MTKTETIIKKLEKAGTVKFIRGDVITAIVGNYFIIVNDPKGARDRPITIWPLTGIGTQAFHANIAQALAYIEERKAGWVGVLERDHPKPNKKFYFACLDESKGESARQQRHLDDPEWRSIRL